ncbi:MAG TPA: MBL fold metallo-hydrolase [Casimicrobiaceae bacterium]|nr:MBL fold metallo-hydrolase [Casimicrobiaceae bacterium]
MPLPPQLHVFVRDWLSANNVVLKSRDGHVLIDSGYGSHAPLTLALLASPRGLGGEPLSLLANTHGHSDHVGGNAAVRAAYGCPIAFPAAEAPAIERWDGKLLLYEYADQQADRFAVDLRLETGSTHVWGDLEWRMLAAPGHDMHALVFWNPEHRILVSGDALWENGYGLVMPRAIDPQAIPATRATLDMIAGLDARFVIPGHGEVFTDVGAALERAYRRTEAFEADDERVARHVLKVLLVFCLLARRSMRIADLPAYVERVGVYRDLNAAVLRMTPETLVDLLVGELLRGGAIERRGEDIVPA